ncbi:putative voltage-dependent anion channel-forming protein [Cladobotryum mycophilum]|uniref:Voltage-dependent anion channel-forming protein n=1 Tax=Cladobotryum mycophilum TaxID=491253 RepID=A0ABR0SDC1_9HYPO
MADSVASSAAATAHEVEQHEQQDVRRDDKAMHSLEIPVERIMSPRSPNGVATPPMYQQRPLEFGNYFVGPRDLSKHSKWPLFMQMHGSILPKMIVPLLLVGAWATCITLISKKVHPLEVNSVLLTITGFVVSMGLSFRSSTAYERYSEGRRLWASLVTSSQALGRIFWIHGKERPDQDARRILLNKISAMNLIVAFSVSLKHDLRFEPYTDYPDLDYLVGHLDTFAKAATETMAPNGGVGRKSFFKSVGEYLGLSFAASNPRKLLKRAEKPLGNLPLEILNHIAITIDMMIQNEQLTMPIQQTVAYNNIAVLNDVLTGCQRVLNTPLPVAYSIAITQITWVYVLLLPFQLVKLLEYITIPATVAASYIILGLLMIGQEIENPFGSDVNDLPLESYCDQIQRDLDIIASYEKRHAESFLMNPNNVPLYPVSSAPVDVWMQRSEPKLREAIKNKPNKTFQWQRWRGGEQVDDEEMGKRD